MISELQTPRLLLKPLSLFDAPQIQLLFPHYELVRFLADRVPWPYPADGAHRYIEDLAIPAMERGDEWHWTLRLKTAPTQLIGTISLMKGDKQNRGFWLGLAWQGQGFMTEAAEVVTDYWFNVLKFPVLRAPKAIPNETSRRISEKQGMRVVAIEERDYVSGKFPSEIWEITAADWNARREL
jgi:ribosomal-protein-alanine N-acetyltransferase